ncbi:MAG: hypothetical protein EVJ46_04070 [Candidatus Acididesulfobacter guangdongensis]|uniref:Uncharacterized protein n=1 Tax=Acididesulfobacter guangdongensis TaxID=2597225 RepID=A0A519BJI6_ACIG2|nr:MAG: hypothetical protein EVJ46_04070 [Candidatus Acididesulfobacter guangdongensis]
MKWFKKGTSEKKIEKNDSSKHVKNKSGKKYALPGLILMAISGVIIYVYIANINEERHIVLPHSALNLHLNKSNLKSETIYKAKPSLPSATLKKSLTLNKFAIIKTAKLKTVKQNSKIKKTKYLNNMTIKTGSYSSVIYRLNEQIEIEKLQHELALIKDGKNTAATSKLNFHTAPDNLDGGIFGLPPRQYINPLKEKTNELSKYFNSNTKHNNNNSNAIRLIGVSNKSADISIGKSDFIIQSGCRLYGYQVLKIGKNSITVAKNAKIKKIYIY